jgi:hypothetical protein
MWIGNFHRCFYLTWTLNKTWKMQCCESASRIRCLFDPWSRDPGWVIKSKPRSEMNIPDHNSESLETIFWVKNIFNSSLRIRSLFDPGSGTNIPDPQHWENVKLTCRPLPWELSGTVTACPQKARRWRPHPADRQLTCCYWRRSGGPLGPEGWRCGGCVGGPAVLDTSRYERSVSPPHPFLLPLLPSPASRRLQRDVVYLCWPIAPPASYTSLNAGGMGGRIAGSQPMSTAVHITWHGAQINFGDLTPYLTYACKSQKFFFKVFCRIVTAWIRDQLTKIKIKNVQQHSSSECRA